MSSGWLCCLHIYLLCSLKFCQVHSWSLDYSFLGLLKFIALNTSKFLPQTISKCPKWHRFSQNNDPISLVEYVDTYSTFVIFHGCNQNAWQKFLKKFVSVHGMRKYGSNLICTFVWARIWTCQINLKGNFFREEISLEKKYWKDGRIISPLQSCNKRSELLFGH